MMTINTDRTNQAGNETEELHTRLINKRFTMF